MTRRTPPADVLVNAQPKESGHEAFACLCLPQVACHGEYSGFLGTNNWVVISFDWASWVYPIQPFFYNGKNRGRRGARLACLSTERTRSYALLSVSSRDCSRGKSSSSGGFTTSLVSRFLRGQAAICTQISGCLR